MGSFRCCGDEIAVAWGPSQEPQQTRLGKEPLRLFGKGWSAGPEFGLGAADSRERCLPLRLYLREVKCKWHQSNHFKVNDPWPLVRSLPAHFRGSRIKGHTHIIII